MSCNEKSLVFHVGDPKTGSSSIQGALVQGNIRVGGRAVFYPASFEHNDLVQHFEALYSGSGGISESSEQRIDALAERVRCAEPGHCVVSAELFWESDPAGLKRVIEDRLLCLGERYRIVAYVRPHAQWLTSYFGELVKIGCFEGDLEEFFLEWRDGHSAFPYHRRFLAWRRAFGGRFVLRPFIPTEFVGGSVVSDFAQAAFGPERVDVVNAEPRRNRSLSLEDLMRALLLQRNISGSSFLLHHHLGWEFQRILGTLREEGIAGWGDTRIRMHDALARRVRREFIEDAQAVDRDFFHGVPLMESGLTEAVAQACPVKQSVRPEDHLDESEIRITVLHARMIDRILQSDPDGWVDASSLCGSRRWDLMLLYPLPPR